jgi:hypothetical protein
VKPPGTLLRHADREHLLVEGGFNGETRAVVVLVRPGDPDFPAAEAARPVHWGSQGDWLPVARRTAEGLSVPDGRHAAHAARLQAVLDAYDARRRAPPVVAWAVRRGEGFAGALHPALPMGFAAACHETREAAAATPGAEELVPVESLPMFFTHLVREGYAGVLWNDRLPVYFCVDEHEDLQFLRVSPPAGEGSEPVFEILGLTGAFEPYDGEEQIEFIDNRDDCDARLVSALGRVALADWPAGNRLWTLGPSLGVPSVLQSPADDDSGEPALPHGVLFASEDAADDFRREVAPDLVVFPVQDVAAFLAAPPMAGCIAALNPGGHRASSGLLWHDGQRVVLDSFSGFWRYERGRFELLTE